MGFSLGCYEPQQRLVGPVMMAGAPSEPGRVVAPSGDPLRFPKLVMAMPTGAILDLGVVVLPEMPNGQHEALLSMADRLRADGFVIERRALASVYELPEELASAVADGQGDAVNEVSETLDLALSIVSVAAAVAGCATSSHCPDLMVPKGPDGSLLPLRQNVEGATHTYLRAYRHAPRGEPQPVPGSVVLKASVRRALESALTQADQLVALHASLARGLVSMVDYGVLREALIRGG